MGHKQGILHVCVMQYALGTKNFVFNLFNFSNIAKRSLVKKGDFIYKETWPNMDLKMVIKWPKMVQIS